jgi:hypothetical protein
MTRDTGIRLRNISANTHRLNLLIVFAPNARESCIRIFFQKRIILNPDRENKDPFRVISTGLPSL